MDKQSGDVAGPVDLATCHREPIHIPGRVQPYGLLLVLTEPGLAIEHVSANASDLLGRAASSLIGLPLAEAIGAGGAGTIASGLAHEDVERNPLLLSTISARGRSFQAIVHRYARRLIVELEIAGADGGTSLPDLFARLRGSVARLQAASSPEDLCERAAGEVRRLTGFDRVLVYRFDRDWNGLVVAESRVDDPAVASYRDHHFPSSDIPRQAREMYRLSRIRLIADVNYRPVDVVPRADPPIDLTYSVLRSVSPIHLEYMRNMGMGASMSVSIVVRAGQNAPGDAGELWGLIACHHRTPLHVRYEIRTACETIAQVMSVQLAGNVRTPEFARRIDVESRLARLVEHMGAQDSFALGLVSDPQDLLAVAGATGAVVRVGDALHRVGAVPNDEAIGSIVRWLSDRSSEDSFATDHLSEHFPDAAAFAEIASGVLAISIPGLLGGHVLWFRPQVVRTITWAGDPNKPAAAEPGGRINPRKSFAAWEEKVHRRSTPWSPIEVDAAAELREAIVRIVLHKAEELDRLSADLVKTNKELEAFSYSVSHDLRAPFRHIVGFSQLLRERLKDQLDPTGRRYLETIAGAAEHAGALVDGLLAFSQMGNTALDDERLNLSQVFQAARDDVVASEAAGRSIQWRVADLPEVRGDRTLLTLVARNLLSNAVKYTRRRQHAVVDVGCFEEPDRYIFVVRDNGVGFDMAYAGKLFGVFQRLHLQEDFEGTGIGLANVRRIIERHGGQTWAEAKPDEGAAFFFSLPKPQRGP